ncbi:hypothetical protein, partial [Loktanella sp. D2R18]|uniref:hypothetical protein n=2 Tax=Rhodobacterales TaxID=204455 RepID=UPI0015F081DE
MSKTKTGTKKSTINDDGDATQMGTPELIPSKLGAKIDKIAENGWSWPRAMRHLLRLGFCKNAIAQALKIVGIKEPAAQIG